MVGRHILCIDIIPWQWYDNKVYYILCIHNNFIYMAKESSFSFCWNTFFDYYVTHSVMCLDFFQIIKVKTKFNIRQIIIFSKINAWGIMWEINVNFPFFFYFSAKRFRLRVVIIYKKRNEYQANVCDSEFEFI